MNHGNAERGAGHDVRARSEGPRSSTPREFSVPARNRELRSIDGSNDSNTVEFLVLRMREIPAVRRMTPPFAERGGFVACCAAACSCQAESTHARNLQAIIALNPL